MAGTGKSTVARTVAREHQEQKTLGASFFFSRGGGEAGNAHRFFTTIAFQLTRTSAALKRCVINAVDENRDITKRAVTEQWRLLILEPLSIVRGESSQPPLLLVIDALDECDSDQDVQLILKLLASANTHISSSQLRVLVTSRPDTPIRLGFRDNPGIWHRDLVLNEVPREIVDHDINIYFSDQFKDIISSQDAHIIARLVKRASGLFIWAATVCRYVKSGKRFASKRLSTILEKGMTASTPEKELDQIYTTILSDSISGDYQNYEKEELFSDFRNVVGTIVVLFKPLSAGALASLLRISEPAVKEVLLDLHSVLEVPASSAGLISLLHPSFRDFLLADERCSEPQLRVDGKHSHRMLMDGCIGVMSSSLRRDICSLRLPGTLLSDVTRSEVELWIRPELQYACLYWVQHLEKSVILLQDQDKVDLFLRLHLLHWLEALAWLGRVSEAILALISLEGQIQAKNSPRLLDLVRDAERFAVYNRRIMEEAPLQLYCSALIFAPENSIIRRQFHQDIPSWILTRPKIQSIWGAPLQTLEGHSGTVNSVAFSPDGRSVVSGSADKTVRLWNAATGAALQTLKGHSGGVTSVAFSPDGRSVVSGSDDKTVLLWDAATGAPLQTLEGHSGSVRSVAFSPDGSSVVSGAYDKTVRLWDAAMGAPLQTLESHCNLVSSVAISPDNCSVVSGSFDKTVRVWDTATGALLRTLQGDLGGVSSVAFSPDGRSIVSGSFGKTVRIWDAATGAPLQTLEGDSDSFNLVGFSPDGRFVVSGSLDKTVRAWDPTTGAPLQTLEGDSDSFNSVAFSPDGSSVVSGSDGKTVGDKVVHTLLLSGNWLAEGEQKLIWIHPDHRGQLIGRRMGIVVLTQPSGRILIMRFKEGLKVI